MQCSDAGKLGAAKRTQYEREVIRAKAALMHKGMGRPVDPRLYPPLLLTKKDQA